MDSTAIDFMTLRKLEKLRAKKERRRKLQLEEKEKEPQNCVSSSSTSRTGDDVAFGPAADVAGSGNNANDVKHKDVTNSSPESSRSTEHFDLPTTSSYKSCFNTKVMENPNIEQYEIHHQLSHDNQSNSEANTNTNTNTLKHVYYIPQCLNTEYMQSLSSWLHSLPQINEHSSITMNHEHDFNGKWTRLKHARRNVALFDLRINSNDNNNCKNNDRTNNNHILLQQLCQILVEIQAFPKSYPPNHVLVNEYKPMEGIMPHTDGPLYYHRTATFSVGGDVLFNFTKRGIEYDQVADNDDNAQRNNDNVMQIMLSGKGSLIVFTDDAYINHCHSINDRISDEMIEYADSNCVNLDNGAVVKRDQRISLTFRHKY